MTNPAYLPAIAFETEHAPTYGRPSRTSSAVLLVGLALGLAGLLVGGWLEIAGPFAAIVAAAAAGMLEFRRLWAVTDPASVSDAQRQLVGASGR